MSENPPTVTVIIPTYNSSSTLNLSLETVLKQDLTDFEVWVVGDGCTDDSEEVVASFDDGRVRWMNLPVNSGTPSEPRNEGLRRARGRFIAYLGHDDLWFPWHLSELVDCAEESDSDFVFSLGMMMGPEGITGAFTLPQQGWPRQSGISPSNWLHQRRLTEVIGYWSADLRTGDDRDFLQRVLAANVRLGFRQQFSVLKFPATLWRMYSLTSNYPQLPYVEAMSHDAEALRIELLTELATAMARQGLTFHKPASRLPAPLRALILRVFAFYGYRRWPLDKFSHWRYRQKSGLADKQR